MARAGDLMNSLERLEGLSTSLLAHSREATVSSHAAEVIDAYESLDPKDRAAYFGFLRDEMTVDHDALRSAATSYLESPDEAGAVALGTASEPVRREFLRLLNTAPGGTRSIVDMRRDLLELLSKDPGLRVVDAAFLHVLRSWFNQGFLELRRLDWSTPAAILEKLIAYEAVHAIVGWDDLRRRLESDRRLYAYMHTALPDEPLIFVEVALVDRLVGSIEDVLTQPPAVDLAEPTTAIFYSITNTQPGLSSISFGNFLIKQVMGELQREIPTLETFSTLSPIPGFLVWLRGQSDEDLEWMDSGARARLPALNGTEWIDFPWAQQDLEPVLMQAAAHYLYTVKRPGSDPPRPIDSVARFHLRNGASIHRLNWMGDPSPKGLGESAGMLVNYLYDADAVVANVEAFVGDGTIAASDQIKELAAGRTVPATDVASR
ncbi:Malonyl-CoA decarboxylase [hydrothermal vent metagenome]|uniref:Malonyl-CoA decarboxylase n=1 Tax=hydrothermal vent metagenome TaxID=652676 RepID=A0A3B0RB14_9ZZZZ